MNALRFARRASAMVLATALLAACADPTGDDHEEPNVAGVEITVGTSTVKLAAAQTGTLSLQSGVAHAATVRVLDATGSDDPVIVEHSADYEIRITQDGVSRFSGSSSAYPYTGTITTGAATGQAVYRVAIFSTEHGHEEGFGFLTLTVTEGTVQ